MASIFENLLGGGHDKRVEWKQTGTDTDGAGGLCRITVTFYTGP